MNSVFDLLVLLVFFAPIAIMVLLNLIFYRLSLENSAPQEPVAMPQRQAVSCELKAPTEELKFAPDLTQAEGRSVAQGLREEELAMFDIPTTRHPVSSNEEEREIAMPQAA